VIKIGRRAGWEEIRNAYKSQLENVMENTGWEMLA